MITGSTAEIRHFHLFCGLGGGGKGFNRGAARVDNVSAKMRCLGGIDSDPASIEDFTREVGVAGTVMDLFEREQYIAWHGREPDDDWREMTPADIRRAAGNERPHIIFTSPPCKGFSSLQTEARSRSEKYTALNALTLRGIWLALEAWRDDPPEFFLLENVPRISDRGRPLVDRICSLLQHFGYATAETTHDCGVLGGLAQKRKRFLLVARHVEKVPPFLYEPESKPLKSVGDILGRLPLPVIGQDRGLHRLPNLEWKTWCKLAFVEPGGDWRSLDRLAVVNGRLRDYGIVPVGGGGVLGLDDPSSGERSDYNRFGVTRWDQVSATVTSQRSPGQGRFSVADPRYGKGGRHFGNVFRVVRYDDPAHTISAQGQPSNGALSVADVRPNWKPTAHGTKLRVNEWESSVGTVTGTADCHAGAQSVADVRCNWNPNAHRSKFRVGQWDNAVGTVTGSSRCSSGALAFADPRAATAPGIADEGGPLPADTDRLQCMLLSENGHWHRPFTTLELAALQSLVTPEEADGFVLAGKSDGAWRERIGNAVPPDAAQAIASVMAQTLLLSWTQSTMILPFTDVWVRPMVAAIQCGSDGKQPQII